MELTNLINCLFMNHSPEKNILQDRLIRKIRDTPYLEKGILQDQLIRKIRDNGGGDE